MVEHRAGQVATGTARCTRRWPRRALFRVGVVLAAALALPGTTTGQASSAGPATADGSVVIYLVRHAERADDHPTDPSLTPAGTERAELLARMLADARIDHIHSTPLRRTRATAAPLAAALGIEVGEYAPGELAAFADRLRSIPGRHLVSGHSNTTPALVELLGGEPGPPIVEATEYDRLYIVTIGPDGAVSTVLLRYGSRLSRY